MFTLQNTLTQIIQNSPPLFSVFFSDSFLQLIPQDYRDRTMEELTEGHSLEQAFLEADGDE